MLKIAKCLLLMTGLSAISPALAGTAYGRITSIVIQTNAVAFVTLENRNGAPGCAGGGGDAAAANSMVFASDTAGGKSLLALILSAQAQGKSVTITGTNDCSLGWNREAASFASMP